MPLAPFLTALSRLLFPPFCPVCRERLGGGTAATGLCPRCQSSVARLRPPLCRLCGMELAGEGAGGRLCGECLVCPPPFLVARSLLRYEGAVAPLVRRLKYQSDTSVLPAMAALVANADLGEFADCDAIVPVPLHLSRHRRRGLNQAALLATLFFPQRQQDICCDHLRRVRDTPPQTSLDGRQRRGNLAGAFAVTEARCLSGCICLVDDVYTTGATARACATTLLDNGAAAVKILTLARVAAPGRGRLR